MKKIFLIIVLILFSCSKEKQNISDCSEIKLPFKTYLQATNTIKSIDFKFNDEADTSQSSWIRSAKYYSCDGKMGYMVYTTDKKEYIHLDVPIEIWEEFKNAESFGRYYNNNIKHKYKLIPENE